MFFLADDVELELYIKINNGGPMVLSVKPSNSIEMIKTQIESLNNIPVKNQILTLNGEKLKNEDKLSRFQIENSIIHFTHKPTEISVHIFENWRTKKDTLKLEVDWTEKIDMINEKISQKKGIPIKWQSTYLGDGVWNDEGELKGSESLDSDKIFKKAVKDGLSLIISGTIIVHYDNLTFDIEIDAFETITEIKQKVLEHQRFQDQHKAKKIKHSKFFESNKDFELNFLEFGLRDCIFWRKLENNNKTVYDYGIRKFIGRIFFLQKVGSLTEEERKRIERIQTKILKMAMDYEDWRAGHFIPTTEKLESMKKAGFVFPDNRAFLDR